MNVSVVNKSEQVTSLLIKFHEVLVCQVFLVGSKGREYHLETRLEFVLGEVRLQAVQIELITNEILVDFAEELMTFQSTEPFDPAHLSSFFRHSIDVNVLFT